MFNKSLPSLDHLLWIEEILPDQIIAVSQRGGRGYYLDDAFVLMLIETGSSYEHKGITYPFKIWNGCFFPIEKMKQNTVFAKFQFLENHPVIKEALYLPADSENFSQEVQLVLREIKKGNPLFGTRIKISRSEKNNIRRTNDEMDTSSPRTFSDAPKVKLNAVKSKKKSTTRPLNKSQTSKKAENDFLLGVLKKKK